jgi:hypothetical protein
MTMLTMDVAEPMVAEILLSEPDAQFGPANGANMRQCRYFNNDGTPCCLVGHVFHRIGIELENIDIWGVDNPNGAQFAVLEDAWRGDIDRQTANFLEKLQEMQDMGKTWQEIYDAMIRKG